jgi:hypothetical protein
MGRAARFLVAAAVLAGSVALVPAPVAGAAKPPELPALLEVDPGSPSLSPGGRAFLEQAALTDAPRYALSVTIDPETGDVAGRVRAEVPRPADGNVRLRMLAGLPALHTGLDVSDVTVDGEKARARRDRALLTVLTPSGPDKVVVGMRFSYRVPRAGTTTGRALTQATIALLSRHPDVSQYGHWFPVWLPPGADADPGLSGFGDIGNFAAGTITARVRVPNGYDVVSGGVTVDRRRSGGQTTVTESGVGLRDLSLAVGRDLRQGEARAGDVTVRATGPSSIDVDSTARAAADDLQTLADEYGPYPWSEIDVVAVSLGPDAGGMEWPGAVWVAGLEDVPRVGTSLSLDHELAHQWWHALVGNDSIREPVVDEPLAQYSICLVAAATSQGGGAECALLGAPSGTGSAGGPTLECADRPSNAFASASEYGSLVYDQAAEFYFALRGAVGRDATVAALRGVVARHAFGIITTAELRDELVAAFPAQADTVRALWDRYIGPPGCGAASSRPPGT